MELSTTLDTRSQTHDTTRHVTSRTGYNTDTETKRAESTVHSDASPHNAESRESGRRNRSLCACEPTDESGVYTDTASNQTTYSNTTHEVYQSCGHVNTERKRFPNVNKNGKNHHNLPEFEKKTLSSRQHSWNMKRIAC